MGTVKQREGVTFTIEAQVGGKRDLEHLVREIATTVAAFTQHFEITFITDREKKCREVVKTAIGVLGPELGGFSVVDLICDNFDINSEDAKELLTSAGIPWRKR